MLDLLCYTIFRWRIRPGQVTADARYGTRENVVAALEKAGIRAYVAIPNFDFRDTGLFGPGHFRYDPDNNHYLCPEPGRRCVSTTMSTATDARGTPGEALDLQRLRAQDEVYHQRTWRRAVAAV